MKKQIIISSSLNEVRIAITENGQLAELLVESPDKERYVGSVYYGKVRNIVQGMNAAFVDIGLDQDAFLHFSDVAESLEDNFITDEDDEDEDEPKQAAKPQHKGQRPQHDKSKPPQQHEPKPQYEAAAPPAQQEIPQEQSTTPQQRQQDAQNRRNDRNNRRNERGDRNNKRRPHNNEQRNAMANDEENREETRFQEQAADAPFNEQPGETFKNNEGNSPGESFKNPIAGSFRNEEASPDDDSAFVEFRGEEELPQEGFIEELLETVPDAAPTEDTQSEDTHSEPPSETHPKPKRKYTRRAPNSKAATKKGAKKKDSGNNATSDEPFRTESFAMHDPDTEILRDDFPESNFENSPDRNNNNVNSGEGQQNSDANRRNNRNNRRGGRGRGKRRNDQQNNPHQPGEPHLTENSQEAPSENRQQDFKNNDNPVFKNENEHSSENEPGDSFKNPDVRQNQQRNDRGNRRDRNQSRRPERRRDEQRNEQPHTEQPRAEQPRDTQPRNETIQESVGDVKPDQPIEKKPEPRNDKKSEPRHNNRKFEPRNEQNAKRYPTFQTKRSGLVTINLEKDQDIVVQVVREAYHAKGVRVSTNVSFPGRYVVFMPFEQGMGVSRKITSFKERKRLRAVAKSILPEGSGCIIRTAAEGKSEEELQRDMTYLRDQWLEIDRKIKAATEPGPVYRDMSLASSAMRDLFTTDVERVIVDSKKLFKEITEYLQFTSPALVSKVELYEGREHVFDATGVSKDIQTMYQRKVNLQSGGSIVIDPTEALVAIDVNSGRASGGSDQEANNVRLNFEAAREVARQIRLRDIGGMIIVDFIDMNDERNRLKIYHEMRKQLSFDRAKTVAYPITQLGLLQITRQRVHQNITEKMTELCPLCTGTGRVQSRSEVVHSIERWLKNFRAQSRDFKLSLAVNPVVATYLTEGEMPKLTRLMLKYFLKVKIQPDDKLHVHEFRFYGRDGKDITKNF
ncbi:MAG TPA: Rne/Rng family ribonuclease [Patescibacteria group bacterium]|nr:Rne/Rng family ribonuclease [Patescibacteria group bacterium]